MDAPQTTVPRLLHLVMNEKAADDAALHEAFDAVRRMGHRLDLHVVGEPGEAETIARQSAEAGADVVVAVGGDGTLNQVVNGVLSVGSSAAVGVLPFGTGNDFATICDIPAEAPRLALELMTRGEPTPIDVGRAGERHFINAASGGFGAEAVTETSAEAKQRLGKFAYFLTGATQMLSLTGRQLKIRAPGFSWSGMAYGVVVGNGRSAGGGFRVAPHALLDDGLLDLLIIPEASWDELLSVAGRLLSTAETTDHEFFVRAQVPHLILETEDEFQVNLDGEPIRGRNFRFEALPGRLRFFVMPAAPLRASVAAGLALP